MASDNVLEVIARWIGDALDTGIAKSADIVTKSTAEMSAGMQSVAAASEPVTAAQSRLAQASIDNAIVQGNVRAILSDIASKELPQNATTTQLLAEAQTRAALTAEALAAAEKQVTASSESAGLSLGTLRGRLAETAEGFRLTAFSAGSLFSALGVLFGVGIAARFIDQLKESEIELHHLSELTGTSVRDLAQFKAAMSDVGVPTDNLNRILLRLSENMVAAAQGSKEQTEAFRNLGISTSDWAGKMPPALDVLLKVSDTLHNTAGGAITAGEAARVLGLRAGAELAAGLTVGSDAIRKQMQAHKDLGDAAQKNVHSAEDIQRAEAKLSAEIHARTLPALSYTRDLLQGLTIMWDALKVAVGSATEIWVFAFKDILTATVAVSEAISDVTTLHFRKAATDSKRAAQQIKDDWSIVALDIQDRFKEAAADIANVMKGVAEPPTPKGVGTISPVEKPDLLTAFKEELEKMADAENEFHILSLAKQREFWEQKLLIVKKGSTEERAILAEIRTIDREEGRQRLATFLAEQTEKEKALEKDSSERITIEQRTAERIKSIYGETSAEYARARTRVIETERSVQTAIIEETRKGDEQVKKFLEEIQRADDKTMRSEIENARLAQEAKQRKYDFELRMGMINQKELLALQKSAIEEEFRLDKESIERRITELDPLDPKSPEKRKALNDELYRIEQESNLKLEKLEQESILRRKKVYDDFYKSLERLVDSNVKSVVKGQESIGKAFISLWEGILDFFIGILEKMLLSWIENQIAQLIFGKSTQATMSLAKISGSAAEGGAGAFASVMESLPFPENVATAPGVAASTVASILAFGAGASFAGGGIVPADTLALLHANEMVLPSAVSKNIQSFSSTSVRPAPVVNLNFSPTVNAIDTRGMREFFARYKDEMISALGKSLRNRNF